jgi:hypothetical protein
MTWRSTYHIAPPPGWERRRLVLQRPLPEEATVVETDPGDVELRRDGAGRVVGFDVAGESNSRPHLELVVRRPVDREAGLRPPFAGEQALQRVALRGARFEPAESTGLVAYPGYVAPRDFDEDRTDTLEYDLGELPSDVNRPIFAVPRHLDRPMLAGQVVSEAEHKSGVLWWLGGAFLLLLAGSVAAFKLLEGRARHEEAEAFIREHEEEYGDVL